MTSTSIHSEKLSGKNIYLRKLALDDVTDRYVQWLNDPETNRYMENRFSVWTIENLRDYVRQQQNARVHAFAICLLDKDVHIGNIKLGPINAHHLSAAIGLMVGDKARWGMGFGTEAIRLVTGFAFKTLRLQKLVAGAYVNNIASIKAFEKCGFSREGCLRDHVYSDGERVSAILLGYTAKDFLRENVI